jgi:hypothetical protein
MYIEIGHDPWQRVCNLLVVVRFLFESPKEAPKSSKIFQNHLEDKINIPKEV